MDPSYDSSQVLIIDCDIDGEIPTLEGKTHHMYNQITSHKGSDSNRSTIFSIQKLPHALSVQSGSCHM